MRDLNTRPNITDCDALYAELIGAHENLSEAESALLNFRLVFALTNHIGNSSVLSQAIRIASDLPPGKPAL